MPGGMNHGRGPSEFHPWHFFIYVGGLVAIGMFRVLTGH